MNDDILLQHIVLLHVLHLAVHLKKKNCQASILRHFYHLVFSCEAQLNKCTCVSVCPSVRLKRNFSLFGQLMTTYDNL